MLTYARPPSSACGSLSLAATGILHTTESGAQNNEYAVPSSETLGTHTAIGSAAEHFPQGDVVVMPPSRSAPADEEEDVAIVSAVDAEGAQLPLLDEQGRMRPL